MWQPYTPLPPNNLSSTDGIVCFFENKSFWALDLQPIWIFHIPKSLTPIQFLRCVRWTCSVTYSLTSALPLHAPLHSVSFSPSYAFISLSRCRTFETYCRSVILHYLTRVHFMNEQAWDMVAFLANIINTRICFAQNFGNTRWELNRKSHRLLRKLFHYYLPLLSPVCSWLRHYATSHKVAGSGPDEVDFFNWLNPSSRTMVLGSTQPLTEMSTKNFRGG
jgi:hypothetical protein